eukprot:Gb_32271 [translate_table: standard]
MTNSSPLFIESCTPFYGHSMNYGTFNGCLLGYRTFRKHTNNPRLKGRGSKRQRSFSAGIVAISSVSTSEIEARIAAAKSTGRLDLSECGKGIKHTALGWRVNLAYMAAQPPMTGRPL